ncbi:hypothetical protein E2C01_061767 [Portunus trituberculatus]|uniref:Uncharacterized protein n=1 Tax=Portunus trituberculatus TaxID=210409 RepID=A0A5B7H653_PORTR|nr:hypothetical protein [Portunus trituberculatus]
MYHVVSSLVSCCQVTRVFVKLSGLSTLEVDDDIRLTCVPRAYFPCTEVTPDLKIQLQDVVQVLRVVAVAVFLCACIDLLEGSFLALHSLTLHCIAPHRSPVLPRPVFSLLIRLSSLKPYAVSHKKAVKLFLPEALRNAQHSRFTKH